MDEHESILKLASREHADPAVLVTLVRTEGSSYRKPGARLLARGSDSQGTISGGCLEAEVVKKAAWSVRNGAVVERYSTLFDDTADIPYGLGCSGTVDLLFEPSGTPEFGAILHALRTSLAGEPVTVLTWLPDGRLPMRRAVLSTSHGLLFATSNLSLLNIDAALTGATSGVFLETLTPPQRLVVFGAGDDARPLVSMAALLGWNVTVIDSRAHLARPERFPEARRVISARPGTLIDIRIAQDFAVVLMTHSYEQDRDWLAAVLPAAPRYLGLLGARHRSALLVSQASFIAGLSVAECCARIYAPVGLDLGGDGPRAIALAIIAEVQACCMGRLPASRRLLPGEVDAQVSRLNSLQAPPADCQFAASAI